MKKLGWWAAAATFVLMTIALAIGFAVQKASAADLSGGQMEAKKDVHDHTGMIAIAIAAVMGASCLGAGYAVGQVGSAAMGAASENPELIGRSLIFVGLAEGIAIYGLIVAIMLLGYLTV